MTINKDAWQNLMGLPSSWGTSGDTAPSAEVKALQVLTDSLSTAGFTKTEIAMLSNVATTMLGNPSLPEPDAALVRQFLTKLTTIIPAASGGGPGTTGDVTNPWMQTNASIELFMLTMDITSLLSQMARQFALLEQEMNRIRIATAESQKDLAINIGELAAQSIMLDAAKQFLEAGMHLGMAVITGAFLIKRQAEMKREIAGIDPKLPEAKKQSMEQKIRMNVGRQWESIEQITTNSLQSAIKFISAGMDVMKAGVEQRRSFEQANKDYIDKCLEMLADSAAKVREQPQNLRGLLSELLKNLKDIQDQSTQAWRA